MRKFFTMFNLAKAAGFAALAISAAGAAGQIGPSPFWLLATVASVSVAVAALIAALALHKDEPNG